MFVIEHPIYGHVNKALLRRPTFSLFNIPEFYELFNSSSLEVGYHSYKQTNVVCLVICDDMLLHAPYSTTTVNVTSVVAQDRTKMDAAAAVRRIER